MAQVSIQKKKPFVFFGPDCFVTYVAKSDNEKIAMIPKCDLNSDLQQYDFLGNKILGDCRSTDIQAVESLSQIEQDLILAQDDDYSKTVLILQYFLNRKQVLEQEQETDAKDTESEEKEEILPQKKMESRLAYDLNVLLDLINDKWSEYMMTMPRDVWDELEIDEKREKYLKEIVPLQAYELYDTINAMIEFEGYPRESFKEFEDIWHMIQNDTCSDIEKAKALKRMARIGASKISAKTRMQRSIAITPVRISMTSGSDSLQERKVTKT